MNIGVMHMKKFGFTLDRIRSYKNQLLNKEKNALALLNAERLRIEEQILALERELEALDEREQRLMREGTTVNELKMLEYRKEAIRSEISQAKVQLRVLDSSIDRQRRVVVGISQEISGLDKLEEHQLEEYNRLAAKEANQITEEFISFKITTP